AERLPAVVSGEGTDGDRRERRPEARGAGLGDRPGGQLGHQGETRDVRGLPLVGGHTERGVALKMLHGAKALTPRARHGPGSHVVLEVDERLAARIAHAPEWCAGGALRIAAWFLGGLTLEAAVAGCGKARPRAIRERVAEREGATGSAGCSHSRRQGAG